MAPENDAGQERFSGAGASSGAPLEPDELPTEGQEDLAIGDARLEELLRRFQSKEAQLQAELRNQEALRSRFADLTKELESAEDRAALHQREATANAALAQELTETLRVSAQARAQLAAALAEERRGSERLQEMSRQAQGEKAALAAELAAQRQDAVRKQERIASLLKQLDDAERRRDESEQARALMDESVRSLTAAAESLKGELAEKTTAATKALEELRAELAAKDAEALKFRTLVEDAVRESAEAKVESHRRLENSEALQREANEAMDAAVELRSQAHLRLEADRQALEEERRRLTAKADAAVHEVSALKADLRRRVAAELAQARAQIDSERAALFAGVEAEREKLRAEAKARAAAEQARLRAFAHALQNVESMRAEQSAERSHILREVHEELSRVETAIAAVPLVVPRASPPTTAGVILPTPAEVPPPLPPRVVVPAPAPTPARAPSHQPGHRSRVWLWTGVCVAVLMSGWWLWRSLAVGGRDYPLPFARPGVLTWQGDALWVADPEAQALRRFRLESGRLREERSFPLPGASIAGLAAAGEVLYVANVSAHEIQKRRVDDSLTLEKSWPLTAQNISALACDGTSLFAAFSKPGRIRQYALDEELSLVNTFFGPPTPVGLAADHGLLWTADGGSRLLLRYRVDSALSIRDVHTVPGLGPGALSGFALRGSTAWFVQDGRALVLERPLRMLEDRALAEAPAEESVSPSSAAPTLPPTGL